ncbi:MAG: aspartate 1-decarboxylase [Chlorobi bacterium]|nr:aspartate 1-decarboxylase [Chlorobiota bacterium]MCI0714755.1 aspartate 1-decarboxylase [Chlorobiota bacterium]
MRRIMCKSKIHRAKVTEANLYYEGSLTVDSDLLDAADILPYERVQVVNVNNGERFETYTIPGKRRSGIICLNGAAARLGQIDDEIIIITYGTYSEEELKSYKPSVILLDKDNKIVDIKRDTEIIEV